jgi:hypothetical protein
MAAFCIASGCVLTELGVENALPAAGRDVEARYFCCCSAPVVAGSTSCGCNSAVDFAATDPDCCVYHQPPPAAKTSVAAIKPIHNPLLLPRAGSLALPSVVWNNSELKLGTATSFVSGASGVASILFPKS